MVFLFKIKSLCIYNHINTQSQHYKSHYKIKPTMSDRSGRKKQPFRFWFPPWRSSTQAPKQLKPPPIPPQLPPPSPPSPPQHDDARTHLPPPPLPSPSPPPSPRSIPSSSSPERRELLPQAETPRAQVDSEEEKTRTEYESERVTETETSSVEPTSAQLTEEMKPGVNLEARKDSEARIETIQEEKPELDSETQQLQQQEEISPTETKQLTEEFQSKEAAAAEEEVGEETKQASEPKISIKVSDLISPVRTTEQETPEESKNGAFKESIRQKSAMKERRITISTKPRVSSHEQKELKDGLSRLVQEHQNKLGNEHGVNIITLASENQGAVMFIGHETHPGKKVGKSNETKEDNFHKMKGNQSIIASINSNVQGINSSIMDETKYRERNPGVHMTISTKPTAPVSFREKAELKKAASSISAPQKLTYEPNIRRRCLRALFMESSEEDEKNFQKTRRHGCRFSCDDKRQGKVEDSGASRKI
ncbi:protein cappuccino-like [Phalaenopsis equestris]|uniref:protein cappuccino-like n=1 Tax=Phalaenopsis equestris TaxID=78828 RepID=UPI0009E5C4E1|nr:protein cappuccino-like [Phalaenopsis equestris]